MNPKEHIFKIRRDYIGEETANSSHNKRVIGKLTELVTELISELAENIYKKDSHFIMELIQNADDNAYAKGLIPSLRIIHDENRIVFQNNEIGFSKKNVDSICSVKKSTKSIIKGVKGYIGEKGIGFKSVFRVCDEPEIYSNGYQFKFDSNSNLRKKKQEIKLGYILPEWIESPDETIINSQTNIILPYKDSLSSEDKEKISDIQPNLLLFLNKLKRLEITNVNQNERIVVEKNQTANICSLKQTTYYSGKVTSKQISRFFIIDRKNIRVPIEAKVKQRAEVNKTRIILAFPLDSKSNLSANENQFIYSYLPVSREGFKFIIQADFILMSGREGLDEDVVWNKWIRDEIAETFKIAIQEFKKHTKYKLSFLQFVPRKNDDIAEFWEPLAQSIVNYCRESKVVLSANGIWHQPEDIIIAEPRELELFDSILVKKSVGKDFINKSFLTNEDINTTLGIESFSDEYMYSCLDNTSIISKKSLKWHFELLAFLSSRNDAPDIVDRLCEIKIIPTKTKISRAVTLVASQDNKVFFPLDKKTVYSFENSISILANELYQRIDALKNKFQRRRIIDFLDLLNIKKAAPFFIIKNHILEIYKTEKWKDCGNTELVDHLRYIKNHWPELKRNHSTIIDWFSKKPIIRCQYTGGDKNYFTFPQSAYISKIYDNPNNLEVLFNGIENIWFINDCYFKVEEKEIKDGRKQLNLSKEWYSFFKALGCKEIPIPEPNKSCGDFIKILNTADPTKISRLLDFINEHWTFYKEHLKTAYSKADWYQKLTTQELIPIGARMHFPREIFLKTEKITNFFGDDVIYYPRKINTDFAFKLGLNTNINSRSIINYLNRLSSNDRKLKKEKALLLYRQLMADREAQLDDFESQPLIYLPDQRKWFLAADVFWNDYKNVLGDEIGFCERSYPDSYKDFFVNKIGVQEKPGVSVLINAIENLSQISQERDLSDNDRKRIYRIYSELGSSEMISEIDSDAITSLKSLIWTNKEAFWRNDGDIFYNDDDDIFGLFEKEDSIAFFEIPKDYIPKIVRLLELLNVKPVSESVALEFQSQDIALPDLVMTRKVKRYAKSIISIIYTDFYEHYENYNESALFSNFENVEIYETPELELDCILYDVKKTIKRKSFHSEHKVYLSRENPDKESTLAFELAKLLQLPKIFDSILIILISNKYIVNSYFRQKNITLPLEDERKKPFIQIEDFDNDEGFEDFLEENESNEINDEEVNDEEFQEVIPKEKSLLNENKVSGKRWKPEVSAEDTNSVIEVFDEMVDEEPPEEGQTYTKGSLTLGNHKQQDEGHSSLSKDDRDAIGNEGEKKAYIELCRDLKRKYPRGLIREDKHSQIFRIFKSGNLVVELKWLNSKNKIQGGYDITLQENGRMKYFEVKSTRGNEKVLFEVSSQQWRFIKSKGADYSLVRVTYVGSKNVRLKEINNPFQLWQEGRLKGYPVRIEL